MQVGDEFCRGNQPEGVVVGAGADGGEHLVRLRGGKNELDVFGRLFNDFQQGIEALLGHHMCLVEDENLVAVAGGRENSALSKLPGVFNTVVAGCVDFNNVEGTATVSGQFHTARALPTRGVGGALVAVQAAGKNPGRRGLPAAPRPTEQVRVVSAIRRQSLPERIGDLGLTNQLSKVFWSVATVQCRAHDVSLPAATYKQVAVTGNL